MERKPNWTTCPDCGCRVYEHGCVNCNEADYIERQDGYDEARERERRVVAPKETP